MADTTNLNLHKPARTDLVSVVTDINNNMDKIDAYVGTTNEAIASYTKTDGTLQYITSGDVRSINKSGRYYVGGSVSNLPSASAHYVDVYVYDTSNGGYKHLVACKQQDGTVYTCKCSAGTWTAWQQLAIKSDTESGVTQISANGTTISFTNTHTAAPIITVTVSAATSAITPIITARTATDFTVKLYNTSNTAVSGFINWIAVW